MMSDDVYRLQYVQVNSKDSSEHGKEFCFQMYLIAFDYLYFVPAVDERSNFKLSITH